MELQGGLHDQVLDFVKDKLLYIEAAEMLNSLVKVCYKIKTENKLSCCPGCKHYKTAGTQCRSIHCKKFLSSVKCKICLRSFVKFGNHKCVKRDLETTTNDDNSRDFCIL